MAPLKKILIRISLILLFIPSQIFAQDLVVHTTNIGFNVGLNFAFGTHFQRLGVKLNFYYLNSFFQANSELRAYFNFKSLGPKLRYPELVLSQGLVYVYGAKEKFFNPFLSSVSNQSFYENSIAYSFNAYFNKRKTTQQTGIISIQVHQFSLLTENDILARQTLDRFRTAAILLQYQYEDKFQAALNCSMWTGSMGNKQHSDRPEFRSGCYMDTAGGIYANTSHGLLSAQFKYNVGYSQNIQANVGIDAEQVRNVLQNKFIHDMPFVPKKLRKGKNCHIPMLDTNNNPYLYSEGQKIRKPKLYLNVFSNANVFY